MKTTSVTKKISKRIILLGGVIIGFFAAVAYSTGAYTWQTVGGATGKFYNGVNSLDAVYDLGKVGIGTTTPDFDLHIEGTTNLGGDVYHEGSRINIGGKWTDGSTSTYAVYMNGNVGIGRIDPVTPLDIYGPGSQSLRVQSSGTEAAIVYLRNSSTYWHVQAGDNEMNFTETGVARRMTIEEGGNIGMGTDNPSVELEVIGTITSDEFIYSSDRRLKENITEINDYSNILNITPVSFNWKDDKKSDIGVIAQDVERYFPELVIEKDDGYKGVNYQKLVVPMLGVLKDQQKQIENLQKQIDELK